MTRRRGGKVAPHPMSPSPEDIDLVGTFVSRFFTAQLETRRSLSLSSRALVALLEACITSCTEAFVANWHPMTHHDHPRDTVQEHEHIEKIES
jgi:hypothetical protein